MGVVIPAHDRPDEAAVILGPDGHFEDASPRALELLGLSLEQLRGLSPRALMAMAGDESEALSETWKAPGPKAAGGEATVVRPDGRALRIRFLLTTIETGKYKVSLMPLSAPPSEGFVVYTLPEVLAAWRAAERRLAEATPGSPEWQELQAEIDAFRRRYQSLHQAKQQAHAGTDDRAEGNAN